MTAPIGHLLLLDVSGFAHRAFHAGPKQYREDGLPTWAITGFLEMGWKLLGRAQADQPTHCGAVFDAPGKTFRHRLFPKYKTNRPARDEELTAQLPFLRHAAEALGMVPVEHKGFEADDVLATLATRAHKAGLRTTICSSDKDIMSLVVDDWIEIIDPVERRRIREAEVIEKFGVPPHLVPDVQALSGDAVDGIPGLPGIGHDKAMRLVRRFGNLEQVLAHASEARWPHARAELKRRADEARLYLKLTTLRRDVALKVNMDDLIARAPLRSHLVQMCRVLEAGPRFQAVFGIDPEFARVVKPVADEFGWFKEEMLASGQPVPAEPQSGYYQRRLVKGGPLVPARIWREPEIDALSGAPTGQAVVRCEVDGIPKDPFAEWTRLSMAPISAAEFDFMSADSTHAKKYRPDDPKATPKVAIDILAHKAPHNPKRKRA